MNTDTPPCRVLIAEDEALIRIDGISAAERIAAARLAPVIILTAFSQRDLVERARAAGAMAYLAEAGVGSADAMSAPGSAP